VVFEIPFLLSQFTPQGAVFSARINVELQKAGSRLSPLEIVTRSQHLRSRDATPSAATSKARATASSASSSISTSASHSPSAVKQDRASLFPEQCKRISFRIGWISCAPFSPLETPPFTRTQ